MYYIFVYVCPCLNTCFGSRFVFNCTIVRIIFKRSLKYVFKVLLFTLSIFGISIVVKFYLVIDIIKDVFDIFPAMFVFQSFSDIFIDNDIFIT